MGNGELRPQVSKVEAILRSPKPRTKEEVRSFLGFVSWYTDCTTRQSTRPPPKYGDTGSAQPQPSKCKINLRTVIISKKAAGKKS